MRRCLSHQSQQYTPCFFSSPFPSFYTQSCFHHFRGHSIHWLRLVSWTLTLTLQDLTPTCILKPRNPCCDNVKTCMSKRQVLPVVTYTNTLWRMLYTEQFLCMLHHSISDSSRKGRHIQFITTNKLLKKKFVFCFFFLSITHSRGCLTCQQWPTHTHTKKCP